MAIANQVVSQINQQFALLYKQIAAFFNFVFNKIQNLKLQEQIAYGLIGIGLLLLLTSIVLFIL